MKKSLFILAMLLCLALFALPAMASEAECTHESIRCTGVCEDCYTEGLTSDNPLHAVDSILISDTHCLFICGDCGAEYNNRPHQTYCYMNGECLWCQTTTGTIEVIHDNMVGEGSDESGHWLICECGEEYRKTAHYKECYDPDGTCSSCGYRTTNLEVLHDFLSDASVYYDELSHWHQCANCPERIDEKKHTVFCDNPGVCTECGKTGCTNAPVHTNKVWQIDDGGHSWTCSGCNSSSDYAPHRVNCSAITTCTECNATIYAVIGDLITHEGTLTVEWDNSYHWEKCSVCNSPTNMEQHFAPCNGNGICTYCGGESIVSSHTYSEYQYNEYGHWYNCIACGQEQLEYGSHFSDCGSGLDSCSQCDASSAFVSVRHAASAQRYNETQHYMYCFSCESTYDHSDHTVSCANPGVCIECSATGCANEPHHTLDTEFTFDATHHWLPCKGCSEYKSGEAEHYNDCQHPDTCALCGADYVGTKPITHKTIGVPYSYDDTYCWQVCPDCGEIVNKNEHAGECYDTKCGYCLTYAGDFPRTHSFSEDSEIYHDETSHWQECWNCPERFNEAEHTISCDNPGVCTVCGATGCTNAVSVHAGIENAAWVTNDIYHWMECGSCGEQVNWGYHCNMAGTFESTDTHCWQICDVCEIEYGKSGHHAICPDDGVCSYCRTAFGGEAEHWVDSNYAWDGDSIYHWYYCDGCGTTLGTDKHTVRCTEPGLCTECGATDCAEETITHGEPVRMHDNEYCWLACPDCGGNVEGRALHYGACNVPNVCARCEATNVSIANLVHDVPDNYNAHDETQHWFDCANCEEKLILNNHIVTCENPGVCTECGATGCTNATTAHAFDYDHRKHDETTCWVACTGCDAVTDTLYHRVDCTKPGVCYYCDIPYDGEPEHFTYGERVYEYDAETHWTFCDGCGTKIAHNAHTAYCDTPGICNECGVSGLTNDIYHTGLADEYTSYNEEYHFMGCSACGVEQVIGETHSFGDYEVNGQQHTIACLDCAYTQTEDHTVTCVSEGKCVVCGTACSDEGKHAVPNPIFYASNSQVHWYNCDNGCGAFLLEEAHNVPCDDETGTCTVCGRSGLEIVHTVPCENGDGVCTKCGQAGLEIMHTVEEGAYIAEGPYHWQVCSECGAEVNKSEHEPGFSVPIDEKYHYTPCIVCEAIMSTDEHFNFCTDPDHCYECEAEFSGGTLNHWYSGIYDGDETQHWMICADCEEIIPGSCYNHSVSCVDPTHCGECGMECAETEEIFHNIDWSEFGHDAEYHWCTCQDCGEPAYKSYHYASCDAPDICFECEAPYAGEDIIHINIGDFQHDAEKHWEYCYDCGQDVNVRAHFTYCDEDPDHCFSCGFNLADAVDPYLSHVGPLSNWRIEGNMHWRDCSCCNGKAVYREHNWVEDERTATVIYYSCICGASKEELLHTEHTWTEASRTEAACGVKGEVIFTCECGESKTEEIPALTHSYTTVETPATCEVDGKKVTTCENCGDETTEVIPAIGHKYTTVETPATCEADGKKVTTCENCGDETTEVIPAIGHKYTTVETPATCLKEGKKVMTCENCGDVITEVLPIVDHAYEIVSNAAAECTTDGERVLECSVCGKEIVDVTPATGHDFMPVSDTAPTCEEDGEKLSACSVCGFELAEITPATGHDYGAYAAKGDGTHVSECAVCGHVRERACSYQNVTTNGITLTVCTVCGHTRFAHIAIAPVVNPAPAATETTEKTETADPADPADPAAQPEVTDEAEPVVPDTLFVPVKVENVVVKLAQNDAEEVLPAGTQLVVYDQSAMLQEDSPILAMYTIGLESDGYACNPEETLRIELPLTETQTAEDFAQYKLVLIGMDGTMTEIEFEIEDGKIIFETDLVGIFAFLPIEE